MGGVSSTVHFERPALEPNRSTGPLAPPEKREEGPSSVSASLASGKKPSMSLWLAQDGDRTLDAVIHALRQWGSTSAHLAPIESSCLESLSGCLLQQHQMLLAWKMSRIGAPGRCGCCETLLPLGFPPKGVTGTSNITDKGLRRPCSSSSTTSIRSDSPAENVNLTGGGKSGGERGQASEGWRRTIGANIPHPDASSCYLIIHAYTAEQQQQEVSSTLEGPTERRRSLSPPRARGTTRNPSLPGDPQCNFDGGNYNGRVAAELMSGDVASLLSQAESLIALDTRRHSVWHAVHCCACCSPIQQQRRQVTRDDARRRSGSSAQCYEAHISDSRKGEQLQPEEQQPQRQQQHLWAVYLWEGVEAPRYILDHARLRTLRLVDAFESCEQRGLPILPEVLLPWASFAVLRPDREGPRCWPVVRACPVGDVAASQAEQEPVFLDAGALLERNVLLLRLLLRPPRLAYRTPPSVLPSPAEPAAASELAAETGDRADKIQNFSASTVGDERATQQHQQQQRDRPSQTVPVVPPLALPSKGLPQLQHQEAGNKRDGEGRPLCIDSGALRRVAPGSSGLQLHATDCAGSDDSSFPSSFCGSPIASGETSPSESPPAERAGQDMQRGSQRNTDGGPLRQRNFRLQSVPKLVIPRLGGGEPTVSPAVGAPSGEVGGSLSPPSRAVGGSSSSFLQRTEGVASKTFSLAFGTSSAASRETATASPSLKQQQQQVLPAGARLSGVSVGSVSGLHHSGLLSSPAASFAGLQRLGSDGSSAGSSREAFGSRRRRIDDDGMGLYSRTRQQQLVNFRRVISDVYEGRLFVSGAAAACDLQCLKQAGITHVVNTIGDICPNVFAPLLIYKTYYLKDTRQQDIMCVFYDCIRFIYEAIGENTKGVASPLSPRESIRANSDASGAASLAAVSGVCNPDASKRSKKQNSDESRSSFSHNSNGSKKPHKVLIHCKEGVSRSATLAIAFLMWKLRLPFAEAFERLRSRRAICSPNTGFTFQLLLLQKRLGLKPHRAAFSCRNQAQSRDGQEAPKTPPTLRSIPSEGPSSPGPVSDRQWTAGKGLKRAGSPLESRASPRPSVGSEELPPGAPVSPGPLSPHSAQERCSHSPMGEGLSSDASHLEVEDAVVTLRGLGPHSPRVCGPPRPGGYSSENEAGSEVGPQRESPSSSVEAALTARGRISSAEEDCVLLLHLVVHSAHSPDFLLWSEMTEWRPGVVPAMSERGAYMLRGNGQGWVWMDASKCLRTAAQVEAAASNYQENVALVEGRSIRLHFIAAGSEPADFWLAFGVGAETPHPHLGVPNALSGLEPMVPEKSEEPFRWRDYCAFDLPGDWAEGDFPAGSADGDAMEAVVSQDLFSVPGEIVLEGTPEEPCQAGEEAHIRYHSNSSCSSTSSCVPSVRRSFKAFGHAANRASAGAPRGEVTTVAGTHAKGTAKLFCLPDLKEPLDLFDSEDLFSDKVYLLVADSNDNTGRLLRAASPVPATAAAGAVTAWLWVGSEAALDSQNDYEAVKAQVMDAFHLQPGQLQLSVEQEGEESETFWSYFANG